MSYDKTIILNHKDYLVWSCRGLVLSNLNRDEEAIENYDKVLELNPSDYLTWNSRGATLFRLSRYKEAIENYNQSLKYTPADYTPLLWHVQGTLNMMLFEYKKAIKCLKKAIHALSLEVDSEEIIEIKGIYYFALGMDSLSQKLFNEAREYFLKSAEILEKDTLHLDLSLDLKAIAKIAAIDQRFDTTHFTNLHSFQEVVYEIVCDIREIELSTKNDFLSNIVSAKLLFFSTIKNALDLKEEITPKFIEEAEKILATQNINNQENIIADYKTFINHLEEKRKIGITNINQLSPKDHKILITLISPSSHFANGYDFNHGMQKYLEGLIKEQFQPIQKDFDIRIGSVENRINETTFDLSETVSRKVIDKIGETEDRIKADDNEKSTIKLNFSHKKPVVSSIENSDDYKKFVQLVDQSQLAATNDQKRIKCMIFIIEEKSLIIVNRNNKFIPIILPSKLFDLFHQIAINQKDNNSGISTPDLIKKAFPTNTETKAGYLRKRIHTLNGKLLDKDIVALIYSEKVANKNGYIIYTDNENIHIRKSFSDATCHLNQRFF
ncbi:MAG: tetratricopeptide repeat protein [Candidatus Peribacteraceae bacterium]|nr:tetratricopeptide repeat protein [Candidatus Peribacteraceae bacterium]